MTAFRLTSSSYLYPLAAKGIHLHEDLNKAITILWKGWNSQNPNFRTSGVHRWCKRKLRHRRNFVCHLKNLRNHQKSQQKSALTKSAQNYWNHTFSSSEPTLIPWSTPKMGLIACFNSDPGSKCFYMGHICSYQTKCVWLSLVPRLILIIGNEPGKEGKVWFERLDLKCTF